MTGTRPSHRVTVTLLLTTSLAFGVISCSNNSTDNGTGPARSTLGTRPGSTTPPGSQPTGTEPMAQPAPTNALELRETLTLELNERVILLAAATDAIVSARTDEAKAIRAQVEASTRRYADTVESWPVTSHGTQVPSAAGGGVVDAVLQYAENVASGKTTGTNPVTPEAGTTIAGFTAAEVMSLQSMVTAQKAQDWTKANAALTDALAANPAIVAGLMGTGLPTENGPTGSSTSKAADLTIALNSLLQQHIAFAGLATNNALGGRTDEFKASVDLLTANTQSLSDAIGSVFGKEAGDGFNKTWTKHIGFFVDYATGVGGDPAKKAKAAADLAAYPKELARFLHAALDALPQATLEDLVTRHIVGLEAVIDAEGSKDWDGTYTKMVMGMTHMRAIGDPIAGAIVKQLPDKFPTT